MNSRLSLALTGDDGLPPDGSVLVLNPKADADLSALPKDRSVLVQGFWPDHAALSAAGFDARPGLDQTTPEFAAAIVLMPRSRAQARGMVADAVSHVAPGAPVWVDGQKTDGIEAMLKDIRARVPVAAVQAKAHGKVFRFAAPEPAVFAAWVAGDIVPAPGFVTRPGVFSADKPDRGSTLLAAALPQAISGKVADLGAGWGWLSGAVLAHEGVSELHLIEADHAALAAARRNIVDARARFHWADATGIEPAAGFDLTGFDLIVTNPPFHIGRAAEPALGAAFIRAAARMLRSSGVLMMVANRQLPYEAVLAQVFAEVAEIGSDAGYKLFRAARPLGRQKAAPVPRRGR